LRNINDHPDLLVYHLKQLDNLEVRNLSIFIPDPIYYSGAFRVNLSRLFELINQFNWRSPSWINSTRFVLDTPIGKVRREDMKHYDHETSTAIFERAGQQVVYPDFPASLDKPGDLKTLLWKGYSHS
jgi:lysine 2,3-aminomutase